MDHREMQAGDHHYRAFVGPPLKYDLLGALQFTLLTAAGLREEHKLCDIGCGSLRAGKMLIPYLAPGNYYGLDPEKWLIEESIKQELGQDLLALQKPQFEFNANFDLHAFKTKFDYLIAQSIFSHASLKQCEQAFKAVAQNIAPEGLFLTTFIWGEDDYQGEDWVYPGCVAYRPSTIKDLAWQSSGLKMQACDWPHPNGQNWAVFYLPGHENKAQVVSRFNLGAYAKDHEAIPGQGKKSRFKLFGDSFKSLIKK